MNLSPKNLGVFSQVTATIFLQGSMMPVGRADSLVLYLIALYMSRDDEARVMFETELDRYGDYVSEVWHQWYSQVVRDNEAGLMASRVDINELLRRVGE